MSKHTHDTSIEICAGGGSSEVMACITFTYDAGIAAHMGDMNYPGHPAEPDSVEVQSVSIYYPGPKAGATITLDCPKWLEEIITENLDTDALCAAAAEDLEHDRDMARGEV
jgi:hypothetical protein